MNTFIKKLSGGDLRSIGSVDAIVKQVQSQQQFDELFEALFHNDRLIVMRAADAVEKLTQSKPDYLKLHKKSLLRLLKDAKNKELKWHASLLVSRLKLTKSELGKVWEILSNWALDYKESRIVRVNSIQALFDLSQQVPELREDYELIITQLEREDVPSIRARIRKLKKQRLRI
jgi:uncharacterized protein with von Willebrand factor type A (vWA) domain